MLVTLPLHLNLGLRKVLSQLCDGDLRITTASSLFKYFDDVI
jgi:hypothetical protein